MKKYYKTTLSLFLVFALIGHNSLLSVQAEEPVIENKELSLLETISTVELRTLNDQVSTALKDASLNQLIQKNLSNYKSKADKMLALKESEQNQTKVDELSDAITTALGDVSKSNALNEIFTLIELDLTPYDVSTTEAFKTERATAITFIDNVKLEIEAGIPLDTIPNVVNLSTSFKTAKAKMVLNDYKAINLAIVDAEKQDLSKYTQSSASNLTNALESAKEALTIEINAQDLTLKTKSLNEAVAALEALFLPEQKVSMESFIAKVKTFDGSKHSEVSKKLIYDMEFKVKTFLSKDIKTLEEAERLLQEITQIENLMLNADIKEPILLEKKELKNSISNADALKETDYSAETWANLQDKLTIAKEVFKNETILQDRINQAYGDLNTAIENLKIINKEPIAHPFNELAEFYHVGDTFKLSIGTEKTLTFDLTMFEVTYGTQVKVKAIKEGFGQIEFKASNGSIVKYQIEVKEKIDDKEESIATPQTKPKDEVLPNVGITTDYSVYIISTTMIIMGLGLIFIKRKEALN